MYQQSLCQHSPMLLRFSFLNFTFVRIMYLKTIFNFITKCPHFPSTFRSQVIFSILILIQYLLCIFDMHESNCFVKTDLYFCKEWNKEGLNTLRMHMFHNLQKTQWRRVLDRALLLAVEVKQQVPQPDYKWNTHVVCLLLASKYCEPAITLTALSVLSLI